jgi:hypothetical protein
MKPNSGILATFVKFCIFVIIKYNDMIVKQIYNTDNKTQLMINLPEAFRHKRRILVVLDDSVDTKTEKLDLMKKASIDPLFLADIDSVSKDFRNIDSELL